MRDSLSQAVAKNPGLRAKELSERLENRPIKSVDRQVKTLVEKRFIERKGSKKTAGYFLTKKMMDRLKQQNS